MKTLALDIGMVCVRLEPDRAEKAFGLASPTAIPADVLQLIQAYHVGHVGSEEFGQKLGALLGLDCPLEEIHRRWDLKLGEEIPETKALVTALLDRGWRVAFFSDIQPWHAEALPGIISYFGRVQGQVYSHLVGAEKPSEKMFRAFEDAYGKPDLYIDDLARNIEGGLARGWRAIQYTPEIGKQLLQEIEQL